MDSYSSRLLPLHEIARAEAEMAPDGAAIPRPPSTLSTSAEASPPTARSRPPPRKNKRMLNLRATPPRGAKRARSDPAAAGPPPPPPPPGSSSLARKRSEGLDGGADAASMDSTACSPASSLLAAPSSSGAAAVAGATGSAPAAAVAATVPSVGESAAAVSTAGVDNESPKLATAAGDGSLAGTGSVSTSMEGEFSGGKAPTDPETAAMLKLSPVADAEGIVWTKIRGHPYWPSQVVDVTPKLLAEERFQEAFRFKRRTDDTCIQYFGTLEIAWVEKSKVTISWAEGVRKKLHLALSNRHRYILALDEVKGYCARQTKYPENWWCEPNCLSLAAEFVRRCAKEDHPEYRPSAPASFNAGKMWAIARSDRVVWAKVRGFPDWPVQIMDADEARVLYPELKLQTGRSSPAKRAGQAQTGGGSVPCMFFGTGEVANLPERCIVEFGEGVDAGYVTASDRHDFRIAIGEAYGFLQTPRVWPNGFAATRVWWNAPDASDTDDSDDEEKEPPSVPKYEFLRRSVWPEGESPPPRTKRAEIPVCVCSPNPSGSCVDTRCLNVMSSIICDPGTCPAGETCKNLSFHRRPKHTLRPFYTEDERGWGLLTMKSIPKGEFVCEYVGEIVDKAECARRLKLVQRRGNSDYYMMEISSDHVLDAADKGNLSRFINSSCAPNCETQKWNDATTGQCRVGIFALVDISAGSELLYNYCFEDFGLAAKKGKRAFTCRCGSDACCMYEKGELERTRKLIGRRVKVRWDDGWYLGKVRDYSPADKAYTVLYDDGDTELLGLGEKSGKGGNIQFKLVADSKS